MNKKLLIVLVIVIVLIMSPFIYGCVYFSVSNNIAINKAKAALNASNIEREKIGLPAETFDEKTVPRKSLFKFIERLFNPISITSAIIGSSQIITTIKGKRTEKIISGGSVTYGKYGEVSGGSLLYSGLISNAPSIESLITSGSS